MCSEATNQEKLMVQAIQILLGEPEAGLGMLTTLRYAAGTRLQGEYPLLDALLTTSRIMSSARTVHESWSWDHARLSFHRQEQYAGDAWWCGASQENPLWGVVGAMRPAKEP